MRNYIGTPLKKEIEIGGRTLSLEIGSLAPRALSAVLAQYGDTIVLATICTGKVNEDIDFLPLTVDFKEKLYAGGRISSSRFIKREGRPSEEAILSARLIDRSIRPLFPKEYSNEIQVIITVFSVDQENDPAALAVIATSAALSLSPIPWNGPISTVRVGSRNGNFILNPRESELEFSDLNLVIVATRDRIVMLEGEGNQASEEKVLESVSFAQADLGKIIDLIEEITKERGEKKEKTEGLSTDEKKAKKIRKFIAENLFNQLTPNTVSSDEDLTVRFKEKLESELGEEFTKKELSKILEEETRIFIRDKILSGKRLDGRKVDEIRPIDAKVGIFPRTHGSALFRRGETQIISIVTLGSPALEQLIEGMTGEETKRYMHHYNFPPFSTGEVKRIGSPGRREIGHGVLAERALLPVIPTEDKFPYTTRVVSEVLSSAGSTSMGAVCGSTLALMDAGVPISNLVAGVAMGLVSKDNKKVILTDIAYSEDSFGDMDFKVAGTDKGITALQMDLKIAGVDPDTLGGVLKNAREARLKILEKMRSVIAVPKTVLSPYAPKVEIVRVDPSKIGEVIGSGGRTIRKIMEKTDTAINVEDDGTVSITGKDPELCQMAAKWIDGLTREIKPGEIFEGTVKRILPFGAMVEVLPGKEGLVHISQLAPFRVANVEDVVRLGQNVKVRVSETDAQGRLNLSMNLTESSPPKIAPRPFRDRRQGRRS
ncbi:polyribonucleotide nucleotidyltransferase [Candidatus Curtissbacteria bacterium RBG_16_39_7]|uniref:Polyribonucleotide nucleotidyltransferase n=1 Tax=Candidatus Curtissbacteria bacterium RBG_16_39_7 TaxID=1797707 RepID=A0A1F5G3C0_9BACT|nr:MAG: polyribonucleotide nucleotidyltransferase [Candidatus Curtissbacteria bacterium RBG_16_39_7]